MDRSIARGLLLSHEAQIEPVGAADAELAARVWRAAPASRSATASRAAGAAPARVSGPDYRSGLAGNSDGVASEN